MTVKGKTILVTGGAGGLGSVMARLFAKEGASVYILDMDETNGMSVQREITEEGGSARFIKINLTSEEDWNRVMEQAVSDTGRVDVVINNAGINIRKPVEEMVMSEWMKMMEVNTGSVFLGTKAAIPVMRRQGGGCIINMSSVCGLVGHKFTPEAYTASKGAVTMFSRAIASRYAKDNIRCNTIHPSTVDTPLVRERLEDPTFREERLGEVPLGRLATADDVAYAALYLASEEAAFLNGAALPVDGGVTCY